jgi:hypothetical protein
MRGSYADLKAVEQKYNPATLKDGWNTLEDGEREPFCCCCCFVPAMAWRLPLVDHDVYCACVRA